MKLEFNRKYSTIAIYCVITFAACLALVIAFVKFSAISAAAGAVAGVLAPVVWGIAIAYLLNPVAKYLEAKLSRFAEKKKPRPKLVRFLGVAVSIILFLALITGLIAIILPQVYKSIVSIDYMDYYSRLETWIYGLIDQYPDASDWVRGQFEANEANISEWVTNLVPDPLDFLAKFAGGAINFVKALLNFIIGIIVAIYLMFSREHFIATAKKFIHAILPKNACQSFLKVCARTNKFITSFLTGKIIDSLIIGLLCFIFMTILKLEYSALISVVVGFTNIIPFFGPFIGAIPSGLLLLLYEPKQALAFAILILALQQFDGNILGPAILGDAIGLSPFWVMVAIFLGGGLFGFAGMILGVPVFAALYSVIGEIVSYVLGKKGLPALTEEYYPEPEPPPAAKPPKPAGRKKPPKPK